MEIATLQFEDADAFLAFLKGSVVFHNSMVDRITSERVGSEGMVPRCEPPPNKTLVIEDLQGDLPLELRSPVVRNAYGLVIRTEANELDTDIALKLRVANGTHTAVAHVCALSCLPYTDSLYSKAEEDDSSGALLMEYLDAFFHSQILPGAANEYGYQETLNVYEDWRKRIRHPHFGLSTFFITQNGAAKGGIRIAPTICSLLLEKKVCFDCSSFCLDIRQDDSRHITRHHPTTTAEGNISHDGFLYGSHSSLLDT